MNARITLLTLAVSAASFATACRSSNAYEMGQDAEAVGLMVQNDNYADIEIYAVGSGLATRVGTVSGRSTVRFDLSPSLYNTPDFRVVGAPIGGNGRASTGSIAVHRGNTIYFTIAPTFAASTVSIR